MKKELKIAMIGAENSGRTTMISALTKIYGEYIPVEELEETKEAGDILKYNYRTTKLKIEDINYIFYDFKESDDFINCFIQENGSFDFFIVIISGKDGVLESITDQLKMLNGLYLPDFLVYTSCSDFVEDDFIYEMIEMDLEDIFSKNKAEILPYKFIRGALTRALNDDPEAIESLREVIDYISKANQSDESDEQSASDFNNLEAFIYNVSEDETLTDEQIVEVIIGDQTTRCSAYINDDDKKLHPGQYARVSLFKTDYDKVHVERKASIEIKVNDKIVGIGIIKNFINI